MKKDQEPKEIVDSNRNPFFEELLNRLYLKEHIYSINNLYAKAKEQLKSIDKEYVKNYVKSQAGHQQVTEDKIGKREYLPIYANDQYSFQIDLTFLPRYKTQNDGFYVLFTAININTRFAYEYHAKDKSAKSVIKMLNEFEHNAGIIHSITSDSGSEFVNDEATKWFEDREIKTYFVVGDSHKLGIINRFHRTLKDILKEYFAVNDTVEWVDEIDKIIYNYNRTKNRGIGFTPLQASKPLITSIIINNAIDKTVKLDEKASEIKVGQLCRIKNEKKLFDKLKNAYSNEVYIITQVNRNTVNLENKDYNLENIKKSNIKIITEIRNHKENTAKDIAEKKHKSKSKLKQLDHKEDDVIENKRGRIPNRFRPIN